MAETVIYPLSEETGLRILSALVRIAAALEGGGGAMSASVENDVLNMTGSSVDVVRDVLTVTGSSASVENDVLYL